ncbi:MAG: cytosolic protein, partial [Pseudomonadota bacterium]|nr:cytosolic protein [Pseudomonadota bacterium]
MARDAELGRRLVDKLARVYSRDGEEDLVLVHVEVQGQREEAFAQRMFVYNYRLFDRYRKPVVSLAVLGDRATQWRPDGFGYRRWGCEMGIRFPLVKLLDCRGQDLEAERNPFAVVVLAHLKALETAGDEEGRYRWKMRLVRGLYERGYGRKDILELFRFIDWVLQLPEALEERFWSELSSHEEAQ